MGLGEPERDAFTLFGKGRSPAGLNYAALGGAIAYSPSLRSGVRSSGSSRSISLVKMRSERL